MNRDDQEVDTVYKVVVNHEEQYSIWLADWENAPGWTDAGKSGPKEECLTYIKELWTDMRPLSLADRWSTMIIEHDRLNCLRDLQDRLRLLQCDHFLAYRARSALVSCESQDLTRLLSKITGGQFT